MTGQKYLWFFWATRRSPCPRHEGTGCSPCGGPLKVIVQSEKKGLTFGYINLSYKIIIKSVRELCVVSHFVFLEITNARIGPIGLRPALLPPTEYEAGWAWGLVGTFWAQVGLLSLPGIRPQFLGCPARIPITIPGPVHAVSSYFYSTLYTVVLQTQTDQTSELWRTYRLSHEGDEMKGCQWGGF
jgi:hypothetical protein